MSIAARGGDARPRVVFFGMRCAYSVPPLTALLAAGYDIPAIVLPGHGDEASVPSPAVPVRASLPVVPTDVEGIAGFAGIPIIAITCGNEAGALARIAALAPDVIVVACFPWRLPPALLALPPLGCLNVHPSLLPKGRGPEPVFWTLRRGERETGVTIHRMDAGLDTGPIAAQTAITVPEGIRAPDLELRLAHLSADLLTETLPRLAAGDLALTAQNDVLATTAPLPRAADWIVPTNLPAHWAYDFARGVAPLGGPLKLLVLATGERFALADAVSFDPAGCLERPFIVEHDEIVAQFKPGSARFRIAGG